MCSYQPWWLFCTRNCSSLNLLLRLKARSWCWRQRGRQCEFRKKKPSKGELNDFSNKRVTFAFCVVLELFVKPCHFYCGRATLWKSLRETQRGRADSLPLSLLHVLPSSDFTAGAGLSSSHWNRASLQPDLPVSADAHPAAAAQLQLLHNTKHFATREQSTLKVWDKLKLFDSILDVILFG